MNRTTSVTKSSSGTSDPVFADAESALIITSDSWGAATIEISGDGVNYVTLENTSGTIALTGNKGIFVYGGLFYRLNISAYTSPVTMSLTRLEK